MMLSRKLAWILLAAPLVVAASESVKLDRLPAGHADLDGNLVGGEGLFPAVGRPLFDLCLNLFFQYLLGRDDKRVNEFCPHEASPLQFEDVFVAYQFYQHCQKRLQIPQGTPGIGALLIQSTPGRHIQWGQDAEVGFHGLEIF